EARRVTHVGVTRAASGRLAAPVRPRGAPAGADGSLPAVVGAGAVGLGHLVGVVATLDGSAEAVGGVEGLVRESVDHRALAALAGAHEQPAQGEGVAAARADLNRDLVCRAADSAGADLEGGLDVLDRALEGEHRVGAGLLAADF